MLAVIIPCNNEAARIERVIRNVHPLKPDLIVPVINGCSDNTLQKVILGRQENMQILNYRQTLGIDIPRALGALFAFHHGCDHVIFLDGDMVGRFQRNLLHIKSVLLEGVDMALTNCYPYISLRQPLTSEVLTFRARLNISLGLFSQLGLASPSHGPHGISRRLFNCITPEALAVPPVALALAAKEGLPVRVATALPHALLGSPAKGECHSKLVADTIIGDCLEALCVAKGTARSRVWQDETYDGYNSRRRFDILDAHSAQEAAWPLYRE